ncbi:MAG: hypothetical protein ACRD2W_18260 [Acidimicrobiales bacterium]
MRAVVQRVSEAQVRVGSKVVGQTGPGRSDAAPAPVPSRSSRR